MGTIDPSKAPLYTLREPCLYRVVRCTEKPCALTEFGHTCGNWLLFDANDLAYHDEVAPKEFSEDYVRYRPLARPPVGQAGRRDA